MSDVQQREWEVLGAELAELSPEKFADVLKGLRAIVATGRAVTATDWSVLLFGCAGSRQHA